MENPKRKIKDEPSEDELKAIAEDEVCPICGGTGEVSAMEQVYPGEPHMADVGTQKCECQIGDDEDDFDDQEI